MEGQGPQGPVLLHKYTVITEQRRYRSVSPAFQLALPRADLPTFIIALLASWGPHENMEMWMSAPSSLTEPRCLVRAIKHKARK